MIVVLEQDPKLVVPVLVPVLCLDLFDEKAAIGRVVLLYVMGRDVLQVSARNELGVESGICDIQPGSQADLFIAAALEEQFTDSATAAKVDKAAKHLHCRGDVGVHSLIPR